MAWTLSRRSFWMERPDTDHEWRVADHRTIIGPLYVYAWRWLHTSLGSADSYVRYSLWAQRPWRTRQLRLRGPLLRKGGHPWGVRIRWSWNGWSDIGPPWNLNMWTIEPEDLGVRDEPIQEDRDW